MSVLSNDDTFHEWFAEIGETINGAATSTQVPVTYEDYRDARAAEWAAAGEVEVARTSAIEVGDHFSQLGGNAIKLKHPHILDSLDKILGKPAPCAPKAVVAEIGDETAELLPQEAARRIDEEESFEQVDRQRRFLQSLSLAS